VTGPSLVEVAELAVPYTLARLRPVLPPAPARLLEVGAGSGALAAALHALGYAVTAVEPDPESARACAARGLEVVAAPFERAELGDAYDAVLFTRVLHHLPAPADAVRRAAGLSRLIVVEDFARDEVDLPAAGFVSDARAVLAAAGLLPDEPAGAPADPLARWRDVPAELLPIHPGRAVLAALAAGAAVREVVRTEMLWRLVLHSVRLPAERFISLADTLRGIELRRIAELTLPAIGIFAAATVPSCPPDDHRVVVAS